jgi:Flp pilus assembly protein CpaB
VRTRILTIVLAAVLGLLGVVAVVAYAHQANQRAASGLKPVTVFVAAKAIPPNTSLYQAQRHGMLTPQTVPKSDASNAVQAVTAKNGNLVTTATVSKGQLLLLTMLGNSATASRNGGGLANLKPTLVAVTVNLCLDEAVGEYATANTYVAVFDTVVPKTAPQRTCDAQRATLPPGLQQQATTLLVLPSVQVLAVGQNANAQSTSQNNISTATADPPSSSATSSSSSSGEVLVTLAVNEKQAAQLIKIEQLGLPYLALLGSNAHMVPEYPDPFYQP